MALEVNAGDYPHRVFFEDEDQAQGLYEKARMAALNQRYRIDNHLRKTLTVHGVAGLFLDPERIFLRASQSRTSPRKNTALHHTRLSEERFATIARSLLDLDCFRCRQQGRSRACH